MKRILLILLALALLFCSCACTKLQKLPEPTAAPAVPPTEAPAASAQPTPEPTTVPTVQPTPEPTPQPTPEPTPEPTEEPMPVQSDYPVGPAGYAVKDPASFAARAEGSYMLINHYQGEESVKDWTPETRLEIYAVGDNLYGFISEWGFAAMEFFPAEGEEGFSSETAESMMVNVQSFSIQSNLGEHWSRGIPANLRMVLTEDGITFTDFDHQSGDCMLMADVPYLRMDLEPGHIDSFCYRDYGEALEELSPAEGPLEPNIIGLYRVLGDADWAPFIEFTPEGLVQYYLKTGQETVTLLRGSYTAGVTEDGEADVRMLLIGLGWGSAPQEYNLRCRFQSDVGGLACSEGDFGDCLLWDGAVLLPVTPADIPTLESECLPAPGGVAFSAGTYHDVWDMELVISEIGAFYYYPANDESMEYMVMGRADEAEGGLMLMVGDEETGEERLFANAYYGNANCLILEFADGGMPQPFVMEDMYAMNTNRLEGGEWYHLQGNSSIHYYSVSEDGNWYGYGVDEETEEELSIQGTWQPADGGGDYRCYALFNEDGSFYDNAYVYYGVEDARWTMSLASSGDTYG